MFAVVRLSAAAAPWLVTAVLALGCRSTSPSDDDDVATADAATDTDAAPGPADAADPDARPDLPCGTAPQCAAIWEDNAADRLDDLVADPAGLTEFLTDVPKGGDLHQHLSGSVWAETYLDWASDAGNCINSTSHAAVSASSCSATNLPVPAPGTFYDEIVRAWSMEDFVAGGAESGHDHFFSTFGKFGPVAGAHRYESIADVAIRAASENQLYVETMFNLGTNVGSLSASVWSGAVTANDLPTFYDQLLANAQFTTRLASDVNAVNNAAAGYRTALGCSGATPPPACGVGVRFIAQVSRTGNNDTIFGQLVSAFEMAAVTGQLVGANLSSPEDDSGAISNYNLHMAMLDFLHEKYTAKGASPLRITLHAGELVPAYLPPGSTANTFHIRAAVEIGHAERIGHGIDVLTEELTEPGLMDEMAARGVLVEVCLSSNDQILEVSGDDHPLAQYLAHGVPIALATDDQGVSRSSMAGEYRRAVEDQGLRYRQLKTIARDSLQHAFLPGDSLWTSVTTAQAVTACAATETMAIGDPPSPTCQAFLDTSERARMQWELEHRFLAFESEQPSATP